MSDKSSLGVGQLILTDNGQRFEAGGGNMYSGGNYIVLVGSAGSVSDGGSIQLWFYDTPELWALNMPLGSSWKAEFIPRSDPGRTWTANAGAISAVVSQRDALAIVSFKFTARYPGVPFTHEIEGFWHCKGFNALTKDSVFKE
ncbi:hypothetical protein [Pseudomonas proteolytica]|uniref:DUF2793 domain-containing protein n=1 Tax=Pseudomonas proteolytica TaxID=219574 RepID=A0AAW5A724_9PSED|nr:hypothetical protein [Pseudomonas proteolytica]KAA8704596.1 hypothetical protein F4W61_06605 [Pseudomonas proteolytica]MCF5057062.1 hypothetical protein [Pseudomonas proteolytica]MCF5099438.1 hypothetical protein [Pseudomonas proteolytica]NMZ06191.1 hypothetical protein [Pseudomonas proteolytica]NMZ33064.1 hypothetical protein [Pseudomonas proteolytica]